MHFSILSEIANIEVIARGRGIRELPRLRKFHGPGRWRKMKGTATIQYSSGTMCLAELHWYEAHGIGRREYKVKRIIRRL